MSSKPRRWLILFVWISCFVVGSFIWKIFHTGHFFHKDLSVVDSVEDLDFNVYVGDYLITREDVEWEYRFYLEQLHKLNSGSPHNDAAIEKSPEPTEAPRAESSQPHDKPIVELYNKILADLIERKLLYQFVATDGQFNLNEPKRFTSCLEEWQKAIELHASFFQGEGARKQLKSLLCERDILQQYLEERITGTQEFSEEELRAYFKAHKNDFAEPARVTIRQVVLASENEAKQVKSKINNANFASVARESSIAPEASQGGFLGPFSKGEMPSFFDIAFEMSPGEIQGIIKSTYGFHIIMLEKKSSKMQLSYEAAQARIKRALSKKRQEEGYKKWVELALNSIPIKSSRNF